MFKKTKTLHCGFTLVELLISLTVVGILGGLLVSVINPARLGMRTRDSNRITDLNKIRTALELYFTDNRAYPVQSSFVRASSLSLTGYYNGSLPVDPKGYTAVFSSCPTVANPVTFDYSYRTNAAGSLYVIIARMESTDLDYAKCNTLSNCTTQGWCSCATNCFGVQNPY